MHPSLDFCATPLSVSAQFALANRTQRVHGLTWAGPEGYAIKISNAEEEDKQTGGSSVCPSLQWLVRVSERQSKEHGHL